MSIEEEGDLWEYRSGVLSATGGLQITAVGPTMPGERWEIEGITTTVDAGSTPETVPLQSKFFIYRGTSYSAPIEGSYSGNNDRTDTKHRLQAGEVLSFWWLDGTPGARAQLHISGKRYIRRRF